MELLRDVNIDWLGKVRYFLAVTLILLLISGYAFYVHGGPRYGIDFKEGTLVRVRFAQTPPVAEIRAALSAEGLGQSTIQTTQDIARPGLVEVMIGLEQVGEGDQALDAGKDAILAALEKHFGGAVEGRQDFNDATAEQLAAYLAQRNPLGLGVADAARYDALAAAIVDYRDDARDGLVTDFAQLQAVSGVTPAVTATLAEDFYLGRFTVRNVEIVGPKVGAQLRRQALLATLYALAGMLVYIALRFEWVYGTAAVLATVHDVIITLGLFTLFGYELSLTVIAALLTLVGYSMNDTIVIFDRVRENMRLMRREPVEVIVNRSINQTLSRTVLTSGLTFLTVLVLFLLGGEVLRGFAFALVIGILVGTYSSVGIAAAFVVWWGRWRGRGALAGSPGRGGETGTRRLATAGRR